MADLFSPFFLRELLSILDGTSPTYLGCSVWAMILNEDSTVPAEIATSGKEYLNQFTDLDEYESLATGYSRVQVGTVLASANGALGQVDGGDPLWVALAGAATNAPKWVGLFVLLAGAVDENDDANAHMMAVLDAEFVADGGQYTYVFPASGFLQIQSVPG